MSAADPELLPDCPEREERPQRSLFPHDAIARCHDDHLAGYGTLRHSVLPDEAGALFVADGVFSRTLFVPETSAKGWWRVTSLPKLGRDEERRARTMAALRVGIQNAGKAAEKAAASGRRRR